MRNRTTGDDQGVALVSVLVAMFVISSFLLVSLNYGLQNSKAGRTDQDAKTATAAAQAGLEEYLSRLNASPTYYTKGNTDGTNTAMGGNYRPIPGASSSTGTYTYRVLTTAADTVQYGIVRLQVTGRSGPDARRQVSRTLTANLRTKGFLSFIYLSDVEVLDPDIAGTNAATCGLYYYEHNGRKNYSNCSEIQWTGGDTVNGPLHSNDALQINGAVTYQSRQTETSCPATDPNSGDATKKLAYVCTVSKPWWGNQTGALSPNSPKYALPIGLPQANDSLATYTTPGADGAQTGPGCYYKGATRITFTGKTMSVLSPGTTSNKTPIACYNFASPNTLQTGLAIPPVIYVDETAATCTYKAVGYPAANEAVSVGANDAPYWTSTSGNRTTNYRCGRGSAYISGTADAQTTVAAGDDIVVVGNLTVADNLVGTDVIGLIADNNIWVYHPLNSSSNELLAAASRITQIQAAILSVRHSFVVQNWADGSPLGVLNVTGAIAQKFRGPVGTGSSSSISTGYYKNYIYDPRLAYLQPPYFLAPTSSQWITSSITDN